MFLKPLAAAAATLALAATMAFGQSDGVKGWTPKAPGGGGVAGPVTPPPPPPADDGPKTITRGADEPPPAARADPGGGNVVARPAGPSGALLASDARRIAEVMQRAGYRAEMSTDNQGNPKIIANASRSTYWIMFLDCGSSSGCLGVEFYVGYELQRTPRLDTINDFNLDYRYIRAALDNDDQPLMYMDVLMRDGGISEEAFLEYVRLWNVLVGEFENAIDF